MYNFIAIVLDFLHWPKNVFLV